MAAGDGFAGAGSSDPRGRPGKVEARSADSARQGLSQLS
jgi:hypothetical protein